MHFLGSALLAVLTACLCNAMPTLACLFAFLASVLELAVQHTEQVTSAHPALIANPVVLANTGSAALLA